MSPLFDPARHEPLAAAPWDEPTVRDAIRAIAADTEAALCADGTWPWHPLDLDGAPEPPHRSLYVGSAGVLWALWSLRESGFATLRRPPQEIVAGLHEAYLARPDVGAVVPSYFLGESGLLLVAFRLTGSRAAADRLAVAIAANHRNPTLEALWGAPGTLVAATHMHAWTGEPRWEALGRESAAALWEAWQPSPGLPCRWWTQDLYGRVRPLLGAGHGFAGNVHALLRAAARWDRAKLAELAARCEATLRATAVRDGAWANWPPDADATSGGKMLVQWCHGAPGIVTSLDGIAPGTRPELDALLVAGGELAWHCGPLAKGPGLCHGTAGNGYAFLKLYRRTGERAWLDRARAFAMHAIGQWKAARARHGQGRYALWTGDPGVAIYLRDCIAATADWPTLDAL